MRLILARHGESVDNVAKLYAGSRDSPLTNHGRLQAKRLAEHLAKRSATTGSIRHVFSSNLQRAYQTAEAIADAVGSTNANSTSPLKVVRVEEIREKDFGLSEGVKIGATRESDDNSESSKSMRIRVDRFLDQHLSPVIDQHAAENAAVVVVAHGIILGHLLRALLVRYPGHRPIEEHQPSWSNTGFLQAKLEFSNSNASSKLPSGNSISMNLELTNSVEHLQGLKKTRGGIGSAQFDSKQRTMDSFFASASKKRKIDDTLDP
ncbi:histidine phosphatase superfamily [Astrocystis sublimbata]|nr:histidine phosphatase superfamily [Astrocystis sublimbata]